MLRVCVDVTLLTPSNAFASAGTVFVAAAMLISGNGFGQTSVSPPNGLDVMALGARCDVQIIEFHKVSVLAGSPALTLSEGWFQSSDVGKLIVVIGGGPGRYPLASRIQYVIAKDKVILTDAASTTLSENSWLAYGTDDGPTINAAIAKLPNDRGSTFTFPPSACGVGVPVLLPKLQGNLGRAQITLRGQGRGVTLLVALAHMDSVVHEPSGWHQQAHLSELGIEAAGVADYALHVESGGYGGQYREMDFANGAIAAVRIGSVPLNEDGTTRESWYAAVSEVQMMQSSAGNIGPMFPQGVPPYGILIQGGDSHFSDVVVHGGSIANIRDTSAANNFYTSVHAYGNARYAYWINGHALLTNCEVDGSLEAGVRFDGGGVVWLGGHMFFPHQSVGNVVGFFLVGNNRRSMIIGTIIEDIPKSHFIAVRNGIAPELGGVVLH